MAGDQPETTSGLTKPVFPSGTMTKEDAWLLLRLALELQLRVPLQVHVMSLQELPLTGFAYFDRKMREVEVVTIET